MINLGIDKSALLSGTRGAVFIAPAETPLPDDLTKLTISSGKVGDWMNLGHTSKSNLPKFDKSGGDSTALDSWLEAGVKTTYKSDSTTVAIKALQANANTLLFVYNGWKDSKTGGIVVASSPAAQQVALIVLLYDPDLRKSFGIYLPNTSMKADGMPDLTGDFVEFGFTGSIQTSSTLPKTDDGETGGIEFLPPECFSSSISIDSSATLTVGGEDVQIHATVTPADKADDLTFVSEDENKVTVTSDGATATLHAVAATTTPVKVTVSAGTLNASCLVTVNPAA